LIDINDYARMLLSSRSFCKNEYKKFYDNTYEIEGVEGIIRPEVLQQVIRKAARNRFLREMLTDILAYIDAESISDQNFRLLLKFPERNRTTYLSCIGHTSLSFYQMQILNEYPLAFEAFSWLFDNICRYDIFTTGDMLRILEKNHAIRPVGIRSCIDLAMQNYGDSPKLEVARKWVENMPEKPPL